MAYPAGYRQVSFQRSLLVDLFQKCYDFTRADEVKKSGLYPYFRPIEENEGPVVQIEGKKMRSEEHTSELQSR